MRRICLIGGFLLITASAVVDEKYNLAGIKGRSIRIPVPFKDSATLKLNENTVLMVMDKKLSFNDSYRFQWDNDTGHITITSLQKNDSGQWSLHIKHDDVTTVVGHLTVYESVVVPAVNTSSVSAERCILLCFVESAEATTLSWFKGEEILNQSSSALSLPLIVNKNDFNSSYRCVAANPADNKAHHVNIATFCSEQNDTELIIASIITIIIVIIIISAVCIPVFVRTKLVRCCGDAEIPATRNAEEELTGTETVKDNPEAHVMLAHTETAEEEDLV